MALIFTCDACDEFINNRLVFVKTNTIVIAEVHDGCFFDYFKAQLPEWLRMYGFIQVGTQLLGVEMAGGEMQSIRPQHRNGTVLG